MKIAIGSDHAGPSLKSKVVELLEGLGHEVIDFGPFDTASVDYPDYGAKVAMAVASGEAERGIVICGTGIGISISANKIRGIRCALCHDLFSAKATREHNDSNVLAMGARVIGEGLALSIVETWIGTEFEGGRHQKRIDKMMELENL